VNAFCNYVTQLEIKVEVNDPENIYALDIVNVNV